MSRCALNCFRSKEMCVRGQTTWADKNSDSYLELAGGRTRAHHFCIFSGMCLQIPWTNQSPVWGEWNLANGWDPSSDRHFSTSSHTEVSEHRGLERPWRSHRSGLGQLLPGNQSWPAICFFVNKALLGQKSCAFSHILCMTTLGTIITQCHVEVSH